MLAYRVTMRVAAVQLSSQSSLAHNLEHVTHWVGLAARSGAELVVLPENFAYFGEEAEKCALAESIEDGTGPIVSTLVSLARAHGVAIVGGGMPEKSAHPDRPYNTSVFVGRDGQVLGKYRKIHLFDVALADGTELRESRATLAGDEVSVTPFGDRRVGMTVCYDLRFPELYRKLVDAGADLVTVPAAFTLTTGKDHWHVLLRARAIEHQVFVVAAAQHGTHPKGRRTYGKSLVADPWGDVIAQAGEGPGLAMATLDFDYLARVRRELPCLTHRRL